MNCPQCTTANPDFAESCSHCGTAIPVSDSETIQFTDVTALSPGNDFGTRYRIESLLGQGGMGRVYKAYDKNLDRVVAIKVVRQGVMGDAEALKRFKQELLLASKISHKNILRIHDMGEVGEVKFISMAYVEGPDLHHILRDAPKLPFERVLSFARQLAEALAAAHAEGVAHRDLKPQNILVAKDDHLYVSDFGLAKSVEDDAIGMTRTGAFLGTPRYMSPEQVEGKPSDQRSDLYAYGLILYEMATGDVPFTGETTLKVMYQRIKEKPANPKTFNPELPTWFTQVIMRCLEKDPAGRYQTAYEILSDLQAEKRSGGATRTVQIQIPEFTQHRRIWALAGVALLALLAFAIPQVRHKILGGTPAKTIATSPASGIPPLAEGKFVAVLPFRVLGNAEDLEHVAEGLNEALAAKLFQLKDLRLASDAEVSKVSEKDSVEKTAHALGSNLLVSGMVQGSADNMRIIVNLDDAADDKRVWSQEFSGVAKDLLTIEDHISAQLVGALAVKPTNEEMARTAERPTDNEEAYDLYLRGRQALRGVQSEKNTQSAIDYFNQSIQKDTGFAIAYAGLAEASLNMYKSKKDSFWSEKALGAAQRAEQLKENLPEVHYALGDVYSATGKSTESIVELKRALQLAPKSDEGDRLLGRAYLHSGQKQEAIAAYKKALEVNPYYWANYRAIAVAYLSIGENEKALENFKRVTELEPDSIDGWDNLGDAYARMGRYQESIPAFQKSLQIGPTWSAYSNLGSAYFLLKRYQEAAQMFEKALALSPNQQMAVSNLADAYRWSGQKDKADSTYDRAIALAFKELEVNPQATDPMAGIALDYSKKGDPKRGMDFIRRARAIDKSDVELIYIQAVIQNLANQQSEALSTLREALSKGYPVGEAQDDPELANLQNRPEFKLMEKQFATNAH
jgi:tetratricopeptide (TPR) repeat protein/TolB-like protein